MSLVAEQTKAERDNVTDLDLVRIAAADIGPYEGTPAPHPPYGVVFLPSAFIDRMDPRWCEWLRNHRGASAGVNAVFLSKSLRDEKIMPGHIVFLDNARRWAKWAQDGNEFIMLFQFEDNLWPEGEGTRIWGGYDAFFRHEPIHQSRYDFADGVRLPRWCTDERISKNEDGRRLVAGQYTSCAAVNILAYVMDWNCTIFVVGNRGGGAYCEPCLPMKPEWFVKHPIVDVPHDARVPAADRVQWGYLRQQAMNQSGVEIIHVGDSPVDTVPRMAEREALDILEA